MAYDEKLAARVRRLIRGSKKLTEREMFGGLSFMYRDRMCFGIVGSNLVVRVADDEIGGVMRRRHVRPMDFTGKALRGFVYVSPPGVRTTAALQAWLDCGQRFCDQVATRGTPKRGVANERRRRH